MTKRFVEALILGGFLVLAVLLYRSTASYPPSVQGSTAMYVRFLGVALGSLSALELLLWVNNSKKASREKISIAVSPIRFWGLLILLVAYSAALTPLGFYLASILFLPIAMILLGSRNLFSIGFTSAGVLVFIYLVFAKLLEVQLPVSTLF